jgi:hypothetical protein
MAQVARGGIAYFYVDGVLYELAGTFKIDIGGVIRTPVAGPSGMVGFTERVDPPLVDAELFDNPTLSLAALRQMTDVTVQFRLNIGKTYQLFRGFQIDKIELDGVAGKFPIKFSGLDMQEIFG